MKLVSVVQGIVLGAAAMYLFDPERGQKRRTELAQKAKSEIDKKREALDVMKTDFSNRAKGLKHEVIGDAEEQEAVGESMFPHQWTPSVGLVMGALGAGMLLRGMTKSQPMGALFSIAGFGLVAKAFSDTENRLQGQSAAGDRAAKLRGPAHSPKKGVAAQKRESNASVR